MTDATKLILQQWGAFGAVLIILGIVIWKLWTDSTVIMKTTIATLTTDNKALVVSLADSNAARLNDRTIMMNALAELNTAWRNDRSEMTKQLIESQGDLVAGLANATNAIEASNTVSADTKMAVRDMTEESRRRRPGG